MYNSKHGENSFELFRFSIELDSKLESAFVKTM